ncbi:vacuolar fusion protein ccz1 [Blyttiomyces sp. JEL0837]|nr:vacuolar fusion protein ccz1 [Blyttiomyces sp. JEL0837]
MIEEPPELACFAVYNPSWGPTEESADQQLCFHSPASLSQNEILRQIGLAQALVNFSKSFNASVACESVHSEKHRTAILEPEPGFWMLLKVKLGKITTTTKDGKKKVEYLSNKINNSALKTLLKRAYARFKMFNNTFASVVASESKEVLMNRLDDFFTSLLDRIVFSDLDVVTMTEGMSFLSLDRPSFLQLLSFVNELELRFPAFISPCILWKHQVVWSGMSSIEDFGIFWDYITDPDTGLVADQIVNQVKAKGEPVISTRQTNLSQVSPMYSKEPPSPSTSYFSSRRYEPSKFSGYIIGPLPGSEKVTDPMEGSKKIYLGESAVEHRIVAYQFREDITVILLMLTDDRVDPIRAATTKVELENPILMDNLKKFLDERLASLAGILEEGWNKMRKIGDVPNPTCRYFHYNSINLAFRTNIGTSKSSLIGSDLLVAVNELHEELTSPGLQLSEVFIKTVGDAWIAARRSAGREFFVIFPKGELGLVDVNEEVRKLEAQWAL